ncbi:hypothetical protein K7432_000604 [Basidiobolus ranarum]|uniref:Uncharacterized protein n=1 Tax=Basidiobolus ranarum TaxID=34480 RepID=A0ABR2X4A6_9FUNG
MEELYACSCYRRTKRLVCEDGLTVCVHDSDVRLRIAEQETQRLRFNPIYLSVKKNQVVCQKDSHELICISVKAAKDKSINISESALIDEAIIVVESGLFLEFILYDNCTIQMDGGEVRNYVVYRERSKLK